MSEDPILRLAQALLEGTVGLALAQARPPREGARQSAVLALFTDSHVLLHRRAGSMRAHAAQVAFPGGGIDPGETPVETALRETWEETGLDPSQVKVLGALPRTHIPVSKNDVTVVVGWAPEQLATQAGSPSEVAGVGWAPIADLTEPEHRFMAIHPVSGFPSPGFDVPLPRGGSAFIWGFTAFALDELLRAGGWERPWDRARTREVPRELWGGHRGPSDVL